MFMDHLLNTFDNGINLLLPKLKDDEHNYSFSRNRLRSVLIVSIVMTIFLPIGALCFYFNDQNFKFLLFISSTFILSTLGIILVKKGGLFLKYHNYFLAYALISFSIGCFFTGGFNSFFIYAFIIIPLNASHIGHPKHTLLCWMFGCFIFILTYYLHYFTHLLPNITLENPYLAAGKLAMYLMMISIVGLVSLLSQRHREMLLEEIEDKNRQITIKREKMFHSQKLQSLGEMAAGIAHEINNPLTVISGKTHQVQKLINHLAIEKKEKETLIKKCQDITNTVFRITKIIQGMRDFARDGSGEQKSPLLVSKLIEDSLALCGQRFSNNGVQLTTSIEKDFCILVQPIRMGQVIINLLNNAFDAIRPISHSICRIDILSDAKNNCLIRIVDNGAGVKPDLESKIFEPFFSTKPIGQGTGIGLSISRGIVQQNNGTLVYRRLNDETVFEIELPVLTT